jgi:hypothetical protein
MSFGIIMESSSMMKEATDEYFVGIFIYKSLNKILTDMFCNIFNHNFSAQCSITLRPHQFTANLKLVNSQLKELIQLFGIISLIISN